MLEQHSARYIEIYGHVPPFLAAVPPSGGAQLKSGGGTAKKIFRRFAPDLSPPTFKMLPAPLTPLTCAAFAHVHMHDYLCNPIYQSTVKLKAI